MMIQAIGFDLDETLLHRRTSLLRFIRSQHAKRRLYQWGVPLQEWCDRFLEWNESGYVRKDVVYTRLIAHFQLDSLTMESLWEEYRNDFHHHCVQMPHAAHVLRTIKKQGISACADHQRRNPVPKEERRSAGHSPSL